MANTTDFQKLRKKRQRKETLKRILILGGVALALASVVFLNSYLIDIGATTHLSDYISSLGGGGYPVSVPGGEIISVEGLDTDLAVLNDTNLYIYSPKGKIISSVQQMNSNSIMDVGGKRVLTYSIGSKRLAIHSRSQEVFAQDFPFGVQYASMNEQGYFAVVTSSQQYVSQVLVYDSSFKEIYQFFSAENIVTGVSVSPSGKMLAVACLNTQNGMLQSVLYLYRLNAEKEVAKILLTEELILNVDFAEDKRISVVTDKSWVNFSDTGLELNRYSFEDQPLISFRSQGKNMLFLLGQYKDTRSQDLAVVDTAGIQRAGLHSSDRIRDMALDSKNIYLLYDDGLYTYNYDFNETSAFHTRNISRIVPVKNRLYYLTDEEIAVLGLQP
ncbi:DUF5711 family protein [Oscillospiraceae bacterium MB08-C2-2]|nr:DUF5711 family protein [Oscillospiraceae bacterium MB08-C2-2]